MAHFAPCRKDIGAKDFAGLYDQYVIKHHGFQRDIIGDRDSRWNNEFWAQLLRLCGSRLAMSTAFHPQTDGQTERMNRTLEEMLRHYVSPNHSDWDSHLNTLEFAYNNSVQTSTKETPFFLNQGYHPLTPLSDVATSSITNPAAEVWVKDWHTRYNRVVDLLKSAQNRQKQLADVRRRDVVHKAGDQVLLSTRHIKIKHPGSKKLLPRFIGPFTIVEKIGEVAYRLELPRNMRCHDVFHVSLLHPFVQGARYQPPPPPVEVEGELEYEVEKILDHSGTQPRKRWFLIKWKGYKEEHNTWEPEKNLTHCDRVLREYWDARR
jgi:hypothetical protein